MFNLIPENQMLALGWAGLLMLAIVFVLGAMHAVQTRSYFWISISSSVAMAGLALLVFAGIILYADLPDRYVAEDRSGSTFLTEDGLAALSSPSHDWDMVDLPVPDASLTLGNVAAQEYLAVIAQPKSDFADGFTVRNYAAAVEQKLAGALDDSKATPLAQTQINGLSAIRSELSGKFDSAEAEYLNTYIEGRDHFYQIRSWTTSSKRGVAFPKLKKATATFYELAGEAPAKSAK